MGEKRSRLTRKNKLKWKKVGPLAAGPTTSARTGTAPPTANSIYNAIDFELTNKIDKGKKNNFTMKEFMRRFFTRGGRSFILIAAPSNRNNNNQTKVPRTAIKVPEQSSNSIDTPLNMTSLQLGKAWCVCVLDQNGHCRIDQKKPSLHYDECHIFKQ
eukprot:1205876-Pleurochrysis_carterae.AAC.1